VGYIAKEMVPYADLLHNKPIEVITVTSAMDGEINLSYHYYQNYGCAIGKMIG
jgi:hypothetical protein